QPLGQERAIEGLLAVGQETEGDLRAVAVQGIPKPAAARSEHLDDIAALRIDVGDVTPIDPGVTAEHAIDAPRVHGYARHRPATQSPCFESTPRITIVSPEVRMNEGRCLCGQVLWQLEGAL